jgi:hypothetical protein
VFINRFGGLFDSFAYLSIGVFVLLFFFFLSSSYILDINPLSDEWLAKIFFSHSVGCLLILVIVSFEEAF